MEGYKIRRAQLRDASAIAAVLHASFEEYRSQYTSGAFDATVLDEGRVRQRLQQGPAWLAVAHGAPVGTVSAMRTQEGLYIRGMAVAPAMRGHGIGTALLHQVERRASAARITRMFLSTTPFLDAALALYERFGFVLCNHPPHDLHGTPLLTMEKFLGTDARPETRSRQA
jgi:GNAT superfamily N-acetyltransferase